jgi:hypothetical protein
MSTIIPGTNSVATRRSGKGHQALGQRQNQTGNRDPTVMCQAAYAIGATEVAPIAPTMMPAGWNSIGHFALHGLLIRARTCL